MRTKYAVQIYLDIQLCIHGLYRSDRIPHPIMTEKWVENRIELFERTTLRSLENQTFRDFRIWLMCGLEHRNVTEAHKWPDGVEIFYDNTEKAVREIDADYLSVTRLDSDDLFHKDAMVAVRDNQLYSDKRECLIFRDCWQWDRKNRFIEEYITKSPPFFTHIFPRNVYLDWDHYTREHFVDHGDAGGKLAGTVELPHKMVCVILHGGNHRIWRTGEPLKTYTKKELKANSENIISNRISMIYTLKDFGIGEEEILRDWQ